MKIGQYIYSARKKKGISQEELAGLLEVSRQSISLWETDQTIPTLDKLQAICKILEVSMDELTGIQPIKTEIVVRKNVHTKEEIKELIIKQNKKFEKIVFFISLINILLWRIGPIGVLTTAICIILSIISIKQKETKYSLYTLVINSVFFLASIVSIAYFF